MIKERNVSDKRGNEGRWFRDDKNGYAPVENGNKKVMLRRQGLK